MIYYYRIYRGVITLITTLFNKIIMSFMGISYGRRFKSCGIVHFRNYAGTQGIILGNNVNINSYGTTNPGSVEGRTVIFASSTGHISIGDKVGLSNCVIFSNSKIEIGDETCLGAGCNIFDTDTSLTPFSSKNQIKQSMSSPIRIGKRVFIGGNVTITKGVKIGNEAVVGSGSVVLCDINDREIWAGNPAKFIKKIPEIKNKNEIFF